LAGAKKWRDRRIGAPTKTNLAGMNWRPDKKTILAGIHTTITITIEIDNN
jgi:hypothetical protein